MGMTCQSWVNIDVFSSPFKIGDWGPPKATVVFSTVLPFLWLLENPVPPCQDEASVKKADPISLTLTVDDDSSA